MGAKAWFIAYFDDDPKAVLANGPELDRDASRQLVQRLFPDITLSDTVDGHLDFLNPPKNQVFVGCYGELRIVAHDERAIDYPSKVDRRWLDPTLGRTAYVHVTHSGADWFAFSLWRKGKLVRSLSVSPDGGVQEQIGNPLSFEAPYWGGQFSVEVDDDREPYPLAFHLLDLSEASMLQHLGFQFEGNSNDWVCDPAEVPVARFAIQKAGWKLW
jgi:hypothetical protein